MGYALYLAQLGKKAINAKPLKGFGSAAVLEFADDFDGDLARSLYGTVRECSLCPARIPEEIETR